MELILAQVADVMQNPQILQGAGLGGIIWVLRRLSQLEKVLRRTHDENMHARRVVAAKLGIPEAELILPAEQTL